MSNGTKATVQFHLFKAEVATLAGVAVADLHEARLHAAYDMGEPIWMVADEMKLRAAAPKPRLTPRQMAIRVVQF